MKQFIFVYSVLFFFTFSVQSATKAKIEVPLRFDRYYTYAEVNEALKALNSAYPALTKLDVVGKSEEGRDIYALTINNPKTGDELSKPGVYVDGNIHGNEIQAGEVCLYYANMLLTKYGDNDKITKQVDRNAHYIIPVVNVDGRCYFFEGAHTPSSSRSISIPRDDDKDGLFDEDAPDDLDSDGNITQMRIKDPNGEYKADPKDPRILVSIEPGEKGEYTLLGSEGIDNDADGRINEDAEGYLDPNRNFGNNWMPNYVQNGAGNFPFEGIGLKAVNEFIQKRPNIIVAFSFHNVGGMWLRAPSEKSIRIDPADIAAYDVIGKKAIKITPGYVYMPSYELYPTYGDTDAQFFFNFGIFAFVGELFMREQETFREKTDKPAQQTTEQSASLRRGSDPEQTREQLKFSDYLALGEMFIDWKPFNHPVYGEIEIGGWVKMSSRLPQPFMLPEMAHRNATVVLLAAENTPEISMEVFEVKKAGNNLSQVRVRLKNKNGLSTMTTDAFSKKLYTPDMLKVSGAKVVAGGKIQDFRMNKVSYKEHKPEIQFLMVPSYGTVEYQFLVEGKGEITIDYQSVKASDVKTSVKL